MATISRIGFGQVEPNHLSAQRTAQIYAQLPAKSDIKILENGQYVKYDYANNEVKLYDDAWRESYKDFAMERDNYTPGSDSITHNGLGPFKGQMVPRVIKTNVGDIYTTNCLEVANTSGKNKVDGTDDISVGDKLTPNSNGYLAKDGAESAEMQWQVVKIYTMADGQAAVKVMRIK